MKINSLDIEQVFRRLGSSDRGLSDAEAGKRLSEFGPNEIREVRKTPLYRRFLGQFTHFFAILLWIAAAMSFVSEYLNPGEGMLNLGIAIVAVIIINAVFTFIQEYRAEKSIEKLRKFLPFNVKVVRDGKESIVPAKNLVPGDLIILAEGDKVPADARVLESVSLSVNNAPLTGESEPVFLIAGPVEAELIESRNVAFAGAAVVGGKGTAAVFATGMRTEFGRIAHLTSAVEPGLSPLQKEIIKVTRFIAFLATVLGVALFFIGHLIGRSFWENFIFTVGLIIANVPEGLLPTVTLSLVMGSRRMLRKNALIKTLTSVETLGSVTVICTDKTGTLTQNRMTAKKIWLGGLISDPDMNTDGNAGMLFRTALLCNNAREVDGSYVGDPTETALLTAARKVLGEVSSERLLEIPFDAERKRMLTVNRLDGSVFVFMKGAPESVLPLCDYLAKDGSVVHMDDAQRMAAMDGYHELMDKGLRVLAFACKKLDDPPLPIPPPQGGRVREGVSADELEAGMTFAGYIGLEDPPRPEVPEALRKCREAGVKVIMITGDASRTATAIAKEIGLVKGVPVVVEGHEFVRMSDAALRERLSQKEVIFARMTPKHKMRVVSVLKDEGEVVGVTGDGVNDAPALKKADIGIAMGITGTDVAKEASDMILLDDNFATIVSAIEEGRAIFLNIQKFITYIFAHLTPEVVPYILSMFLRIPLPITVMQILAIDLGTETIPALALGAEQPEAAVMQQPPRPAHKGLIDKTVLFKGYVFLGLLSTLAALFAFFFVLFSGGWSWNVSLSAESMLARQASTATFLAIVIMQIGNVFACRTFTESVFKAGLFRNSLVLWGIMVELLLCVFVVYHPLGNNLFGTAPLDFSIWLVLLPFSAVILAAEEMRKKLYRGKFDKGE